MSKRLPKGLSIIDHNGTLLAKLYDTVIVEYNKSTGVVKLNSNGWRTNHTKKCINLVLNPYSIALVQRKFNWFVYNQGLEVPSNDNMVVSL